MIEKILLICCTVSVSFILSLDEHLYITQDPTKVTFMEYTNEFNLDLLRSLSPNEVERNYRNIIETIRRKGPDVLVKLNRSELFHLVFTTARDEKQSDVWSRWNGICDFFLGQDGPQYFEWYVIGRAPSTTTRYPTPNNRGF